jgi:hypothetical protein
VDPSTATMLEQFAATATARLDGAAARLASGESAQLAPAVSWNADTLASTTVDPIVRARLTRLGRQLDVLVASAKEITSRD